MPLIQVTSGGQRSLLKKKLQVCESQQSCLFVGDQILIFHHNLQKNYLKILQCDFRDFFSYFVSHSWGIPMMKITGLPPSEWLTSQLKIQKLRRLWKLDHSSQPSSWPIPNIFIMNNNVAVKYIHKKTDTLSLSLLYKLNVSVFLWRCVYIFQCLQATIFTATLLFQPQLITIVYLQSQMIKHINRQFVALHTCTHTLFHTQHSSEMHKKYLDAHIKTKDSTLFNLFW